MTKATLPAGITQAQIEAFIAAQAAAKQAEADKAAKASKAKASKAKDTASKTPAEYRAERKARSEEVRKTYSKLEMAIVKPTKDLGKGENLIPEGTHADCVWLGVSKWGQPTARLLVKGETRWANPEHLAFVKAMPTERKAAVEAEREAETSATCLTPASVIKEEVRDDEQGGYIVLRLNAVSKPISLGRSMVQLVGEANGQMYFEVPAWKLRQDFGAYLVEMLDGRRDEFAKLIG